MTAGFITGDKRSAGFLGKLPQQPDFVRQNAADALAIEFDHWLVRSAQNLSLAKAELPNGCIRFVYSAAGTDSVIVGTLTKSCDQIGRSFPFAIYTAFKQADVDRNFHAIPLVYGELLAAAETILADVSTQPLDVIRERVINLSVPEPSMLKSAAAQISRLLQSTSGTELLHRAFGAEPPDVASYGINTFRMAADAVRDAPPTSLPTVLSCPISIDLDLLAWLDLARRLLMWRGAVPSFVWLEEPNPRLLLGLGYASEQLLQFVADSKHQSSRLWPLTTTSIEAITRARMELGVGVLDEPSVDTLWTRVARGVP